MNKNDIKKNFQEGDVPTETNYSEWIERCIISIDDIVELPDADEIYSGSCYLVSGTSIYRCELVDNKWQWVLKSKSGSGVTNYLDLTNKPRLNEVVISGSKTLEEFGIMPNFNGIKITSTLSDNTKIIVSVENNVARYATLSELRTFFGLDTIIDRQVLVVSGKQDETNKIYTTDRIYRIGSSALYLNGLRLSPIVDYTELSNDSFTFTKIAPKSTDNILFEAIVATK